MKEALDSERCPLDANLEKVIPGLHQWHKANNDVVKGMDKRLTEGLEGLERKVQLGFEGLVAALRDERQRTDDRMADMLADMAAKLRSGDTNLQSIRKRPREDTPTLGLGNSPSDGGESLGDQVATEPTNDNEEPWKHIDHSSYTMTMKHSSLTNMYEEWYGLRCSLSNTQLCPAPTVAFEKEQRKPLPSLCRIRAPLGGGKTEPHENSRKVSVAWFAWQAERPRPPHENNANPRWQPTTTRITMPTTTTREL